jgi:hypothetical protein
MSTTLPPTTLAGEVQIPLDETLQLDVQDSAQDVLSKGLDRVPNRQAVIVWQEGEIRAVATAKKLRDQILPRSWFNQLWTNLDRLSRPPEVTSSTPLASLCFLAQQLLEADWFLVLDDRQATPTGVLAREEILKALPPPDVTQEVYREGSIRLWGDPSVENVYYYCPEEKRHYGPHAVYVDGQGKVRDRKGHLVQEHVFHQDEPGSGPTC